MKSREPVITHGRDVWDTVNLPPAEFHDRVAALREAMGTSDLDAFVVYGRGDRDGDLCYVSNLVNKVPNWGLAVVFSRESVILLNGRSSRTRPVVEQGTWIDDVRFCDSVPRAIGEVLEELGRNVETVGVSGLSGMTNPNHESFREATREYEITGGQDMLADARALKSEREVDQIRRAGRVVSEVQDHISALVDDQITERELVAAAERRARLRGVQDLRVLLANPARTGPHLRPAEAFEIPRKNPVSVYIAARREGYWAEAIRTLQWNESRRNTDSILHSIYDEVVDALEPDTAVGEVNELASVAAEEADVTLRDEYRTLHGIGLELEEPPLKGDSTVREDGTLAVRVAVETAEGLLFHGDTVHVHTNGRDRLTAD